VSTRRLTTSYSGCSPSQDAERKPPIQTQRGPRMRASMDFERSNPPVTRWASLCSSSMPRSGSRTAKPADQPADQSSETATPSARPGVGSSKNRLSCVVAVLCCCPHRQARASVEAAAAAARTRSTRCSLSQGAGGLLAQMQRGRECGPLSFRVSKKLPLAFVTMKSRRIISSNQALRLSTHLRYRLQSESASPQPVQEMEAQI